MAVNLEEKKGAVEDIKRQIKVLNVVVLVIIYTLLFLVIRFLYVILDYIPKQSIVVILSILAGLVVIGLYLANSASKRAIRKIEEYSNKLNMLLTTTRDIREIVYGDILIDNIIDSSLKITGADAGSILLSEGDKIIFKTVKGTENSKLLGSSFPKSHGIVGWVIDNGSAVRIDDVKNDDRFDAEIDNITGHNTLSLLCVPLRLSSGVIGALELVNKKNGVFTNDDEELISYFADQAAISIASTKFYEDKKNYETHLTGILLNTLDNFVHDKHGHSKRVAKYSLLIARALNMTEHEMERLYRASLLHDIGFLRIRMGDISFKEGYMTHSVLGYEMLRQINFYADIAPIILHHHERYDGKGYPAGLKEDATPLESRIIAITEAFDAMITRDSYKTTLKTISENVKPYICGFKESIEDIRKNAGTQFDPKLVEVFINSINESHVEEV